MALKYSSLVGGGKTMRRLTLTSGTSWTVPADVTFVNVTLIGGGGGGGTGYYNNNQVYAAPGLGGQIINSTLSTTPGASITYAIGAGGTGGSGGGNDGNSGGSTTFTGATTAAGGKGGEYGGGGEGVDFNAAANGGHGHSWAGSGANVGSTGGKGCIIVEYWI